MQRESRSGGQSGVHRRRAGQLAAHQKVWHVPHKARPSFVARMARGVGVFALIVLGVLASATLGLLGSVVRNSLLAGTIGVIGATGVSAALYLAVTFGTEEHTPTSNCRATSGPNPDASDVTTEH